MANKPTYWTPKRLADLRRMATVMHVGELARYFYRSPEQIQQALKYDANAQKCIKEAKVTICPTMHAHGYGFASARAKKGHYTTSGGC